MKSDLLGIKLVVDQVEGQVDEGKRHAIVASGLGRQYVSQMFRDPLREFALSYD